MRRVEASQAGTYEWDYIGADHRVAFNPSPY